MADGALLYYYNYFSTTICECTLEICYRKVWLVCRLYDQKLCWGLSGKVVTDLLFLFDLPTSWCQMDNIDVVWKALLIVLLVQQPQYAFVFELNIMCESSIRPARVDNFTSFSSLFTLFTLSSQVCELTSKCQHTFMAILDSSIWFIFSTQYRYACLFTISLVTFF